MVGRLTNGLDLTEDLQPGNYLGGKGPYRATSLRCPFCGEGLWAFDDTFDRGKPVCRVVKTVGPRTSDGIQPCIVSDYPPETRLMTCRACVVLWSLPGE